MRVFNIIHKILGICLFRLVHPYLIGVRCNNVFKVSFPFLSRIGRGSKLLVSSPEGGVDSHIKIKKNVWIGENVELQTWFSNQIVIGRSSSIQDFSKVLGDVEIGENVIIAPNTFMSSGTHYAFYKPYLTIREQDREVLSTSEGRSRHSKPIRIDDDTWIGTNVFVGQGVHIGKGCVIGANSVVTKSIAPYSVVAGVNKVIKKRIEIESTDLIDFKKDENLIYFLTGFLGNKVCPNKEATLFLPESFSLISLALNSSEATEVFFGEKKYKIDQGFTRIEQLEVNHKYFDYKLLKINSPVELELINIKGENVER